MAISRLAPLFLGLAGGALVLAGCGPSGPPKHVVNGKISNSGNVMPVKEAESKSGGRLRVWLKSAEGTKITDTYEAKLNYSDGTFTIVGDGSGVPQGKYRIFVEWKDEFPMGKDLLKDKFSETNSKIVRDIPPADGRLTIDVSKPEG